MLGRALVCGGPCGRLGQQLGGAIGAALTNGLLGAARPAAGGSQPGAPGSQAPAAPGTDRFEVYGNAAGLQPLGPVPVLTRHQVRRMDELRQGRRLVWKDLMEWYNGPLGRCDAPLTLFPRDQMPQEYRQRYASFNHNDSFAVQEFAAFAKPYVNAAENFFGTVKIFAIAELSCNAQIFPYDPNTKAMRLHLPWVLISGSPEGVNLRFPEATMRKLESIRASDDLCAMPIYPWSPRDPKPVGVQFFRKRSGEPLLVTGLASVSDEDYEFITKNAFARRPVRRRSLPCSRRRPRCSTVSSPPRARVRGWMSRHTRIGSRRLPMPSIELCRRPVCSRSGAVRQPCDETRPAPAPGRPSRAPR